MLSRRIRSGLLQVHPREDGFEIDGVQVVSESVMAEEVDVLPCDGGDPLEQLESSTKSGGLRMRMHSGAGISSSGLRPKPQYQRLLG